MTENALVNEIRKHVDQWRELPPSQWGVTPETQRLLEHWRDPVARAQAVLLPARSRRNDHLADRGRAEACGDEGALDQIGKANAEANPELFRLA